jgi:small-conductance mechanosensitive channel
MLNGLPPGVNAFQTAGTPGGFDLKMMPETTEELARKPEVREELARTTGQKVGAPVKAETRDKFWFGTHGLLLIGCLLFFFFAGTKFLPLPAWQSELTRRLARGAFFIILILAIAQALSVYLIGRVHDASTRFTLKRILHLVTVVVVALIAISTFFANWYAALTALGVGSIVLALAVQTPMTSFIGWIYLLVRRPYRVGDRIKMGDATGDVIDVSYLDTTLWEFGGQYISGDHPSGRIIKFPNSKVLNSMVWNYSWPLFPYIWNEIKFQIAYQSDLKFVAETMQRIVADEIGEEMKERIGVYRDLLARTPVDELEVREQPRVIFRVDEVTWVDAIVRYVVSPREAGAVKSRLIPKLLTALNQAPDKVMFPKGDAR